MRGFNLSSQEGAQKPNLVEEERESEILQERGTSMKPKSLIKISGTVISKAQDEYLRKSTPRRSRKSERPSRAVR